MTSKLAPYESGCELTQCEGCTACDGHYAKPKALKLTKQGVRDLNAGTTNRHTHRFMPTTHTAKNGYQTTRMVCWCGVPQEEVQSATATRVDVDDLHDLDVGW